MRSDTRADTPHTHPPGQTSSPNLHLPNRYQFLPAYPHITKCPVDFQLTTGYYSTMNIEARHLEAVKLLTLGKSYQDVANALHITKQTLYLWRQAPEFIEEMARATGQIREEVRNIIDTQAVQSANTLVALRDGAESEKVKLDAAKDLLDRAGFKPTERIAVQTQVGVTPELAQLIKGILAESKGVVDIPLREIDKLPERVV
jgi:transposase